MPNKKHIHTDDAPRALGPYSQAIESGRLVFCSGQVAIDPVTSALVSGDVGDQTRQVMKNLQAVLAAADLTLGDVVKTTIYLASMADFQAVNEVYAEFFGPHRPARAVVPTRDLHHGLLVEIEAIASTREG